MGSYIFLLTVLVSLSHCQFVNYITRPNDGEIVDAQTLWLSAEPSELADGYYFISPYLSDMIQHAYGPQIRDHTGDLIWYGRGAVDIFAYGFHVCNFQDQLNSHLCWTDNRTVPPYGGHSEGVVKFFDSSYNQVGPDFGSVGGLAGPDLHELHTPGEENFMLTTSYQTVPWDLSQWSGPADGYVLAGCIQRVSTHTGMVDFQWCSTDSKSAINLNDTYMYLQGHAGPDGTWNLKGGFGTYETPWDYFHINSVDVTSQGDYLVSARHMDGVYLIAGENSATPGKLLWQLGGRENQFDMQDGLNFSRQHMARVQKEYDEVMEITLFDNAFDGQRNSSRVSSGKWISLNVQSKTAELLYEYVQPGGILTESQGSMQVMDNGNVVIGWGQMPYFSEYAQNGTLLFHAHFGQSGVNLMKNYRAFKHEWQGHPTTAPDILAYAQTCNAPTSTYVSWNGDTRTKRWKVWHSAVSSNGPWIYGGTVDKTGFETHIPLGAHAVASFVEAVDVNGNIISRTGVADTIVPKNTTGCDDRSCGLQVNHLMLERDTC